LLTPVTMPRPSRWPGSFSYREMAPRVEVMCVCSSGLKGGCDRAAQAARVTVRPYCPPGIEAPRWGTVQFTVRGRDCVPVRHGLLQPYGHPQRTSRCEQHETKTRHGSAKANVRPHSKPGRSPVLRVIVPAGSSQARANRRVLLRSPNAWRHLPPKKGRHEGGAGDGLSSTISYSRPAGITPVLWSGCGMPDAHKKANGARRSSYSWAGKGALVGIARIPDWRRKIVGWVSS